MQSDTLHKYFLSNSHKPLHKWIHYFDIYERHFSRFRGKNPVILEIGVYKGGSLAMWKEYFGPGCQVVGIDIDPMCKQHEGQGIEIFIGSQDDPSVIQKVLEKHPRIDIVLDDGSHIMRHMIATFGLLYDHVDPDGVYMIEDTHTCYWEEFDGGLERPGSFMEFVKGKLDEINAAHTRGKITVSPFAAGTDSINCYDSIVVFERRHQGRRMAPCTGAIDDPFEEPTLPGQIANDGARSSAPKRGFFRGR